MKSSDEQVRRITSTVASLSDEEAVGRFLILGGVRSQRNTLNEMLGGRKMGIVRAILDASSIFREERETAAREGLEKGLEEGQSAGRTEEALRLLRITLRTRFPDLAGLPEIDRISDLPQLEHLFETVLQQNEPKQIHAAILAAAQSDT